MGGGWSYCLLLLAFSLVVCGCADPGPALHPLRGKATYKGQPIPQAQIVFHPQFAESTWMPVATVSDDGSFAASTKTPGDGVVPGRYKVTVVWHPQANDADEGPNQLPPKYSQPGTTPLEIEAGPGTADLPPFDLVD